MSQNLPHSVLGDLRHLLGKCTADLRSDERLLGDFVYRHDEAAFTAIVRRHGPMVHGVCRRVLHHSHDAEDAFQATFLVLASKAVAIRKRGSLASWLYGVAFRVAMRLKSRRADSSAVPASARLRQCVNPPTELSARELCLILDEELARLPEQYRAPLLLCGIDDRTRDEAARDLGWSLGTFKRRLARGRSILRARLLRRGVTIPAALAASLLAQETSSAAIELSLVRATVAAAMKVVMQSPQVAVSTAALGLAREVLALESRRIKTVSALGVLLGLLVGGAAILGRPSLTARSDEPPIARAFPPQEERARPAAKPAQTPADPATEPLPPGARARLGELRFRAASLIYACAYSRDGRVLAVGSEEPGLLLFDPDTGRRVGRLVGPTLGLPAVAFSPDGRQVAAGCLDKGIYLWDFASGKLLHRHSVRCQVLSMTFTPDGKSLVFGGTDKLVHVCDAATGKMEIELAGARSWVRCVAMSDDGKTIAAGGEGDDTVRVWERLTGKLVHSLSAHAYTVFTIAFSPSGAFLATPGKWPRVLLWNVATGEIVRELGEHDRGPEPTAMAFSPDGKTLTVGDSYCNFRLWQVDAGKKLAHLNGRNSGGQGAFHSGGIVSIALSPDGKTVTWAQDSRLRQFDLQKQIERRPDALPGGAIRRLFVSQDGRTLITASDDRSRQFLRWDLRSGRLLGSLAFEELMSIENIALSADQKLLAMPEPNVDHLLLRDVQTGRRLRSAELRKQQTTWELQKLVFSPDGKRIIGGGHLQDSAIHVWDAKTGKDLFQLESHGGILLDNTQPVQTDFLTGLVVSPDGKFLASSGTDTIRLHDLTTGKTIQRMHNNDQARLAFSPDSRTLATANDHLVALREVPSGNVVRRISVQTSNINAIAFSPDGRLLATGCSDGSAHLWETATGKERRRVDGHRGAITCAAFTPDGRSLITGSEDTTSIVWDISGLTRP
jgi:RNA polymerase sigma factor (sigma-70 family)